MEKNVFHELVGKLVDKYGESSFIAYNPNLTKKDLAGKILIIAENIEFLDHYTVGPMGPIPMSYFDKGNGTIQAFIGNTLIGEKYPVYEKNTWELKSETWQEKWNGDIVSYFSAENPRPKDRMQILYTSAIIPTLGEMYGGWNVCPNINSKLATYLNQYPQSSGIVMMDFFGADDELGGHRFHGDELANALVNCNSILPQKTN